MAWDELARMAGDDNSRDRERWIGIYIGALAVILAICATGGGNAAKEATIKHIEASNTWAFFQAKNLRRQVIRLQVEEFEQLLAAMPTMPAEAKAAITARIAAHKEQDTLLTTNAKTGEGLDELFQKGKALEEARDLALRKDPYFDYAEACLQIAIVLAGVALLSSGSLLIVLSGGLAALGTLLTVNGFILAFAVPGIG